MESLIKSIVELSGHSIEQVMATIAPPINILDLEFPVPMINCACCKFYNDPYMASVYSLSTVILLHPEYIDFELFDGEIFTPNNTRHLLNAIFSMATFGQRVASAPYASYFDQAAFDQAKFIKVEPIITILMNKIAIVDTSTCWYCSMPSTNECENCSIATYCCKEHQENHWSEHKMICRSFQQYNH